MLKEEENCKEGQLPEGTCPPQLLERYITMTNFLLEPRSHLYVLPHALQFCKLIMVRYCEVDNSTPIFRLYHKATRHNLLSSKKQGNSIGCNYIISRSSIPQKDSSYVGKLRGNFVGNEFMVYDNGDSSSSSSKCRKQLGLIKISSKTLWGNAEEGQSIFYVPKPVLDISRQDADRRYRPQQYLISNEQPFTNIVEKHSQYLETLTCRLKTTDHKIQLLNASKTPSLTLSQLSSHTIEIQIGSPLTLLQGFAFILTMIQGQYI